MNVDKNDGNLNIPEAEASELAATIAELETGNNAVNWSGVVLCTKRTTEVGREC